MLTAENAPQWNAAMPAAPRRAAAASPCGAARAHVDARAPLKVSVVGRTQENTHARRYSCTLPPGVTRVAARPPER